MYGVGLVARITYHSKTLLVTENKMITLNWIFTNEHKYSKLFDSVDDAISFVEHVNMYSNYQIDRVWIDKDNEQIWLKEKA